MRPAIIFVCTGNICRSPLAHGVLDHHLDREGLAGAWRTESAGTHGYHVGDQPDSRMVACAARHGVRLDHRALKAERAMLHDYDLIVAMGHDHLAWLRTTVPDLADRVRLFRSWDPEVDPGLPEDAIPEVPDPYYGDSRDFEEVWRIVDRTVPHLLRHLTTRHP